MVWMQGVVDGTYTEVCCGAYFWVWVPILWGTIMFGLFYMV